MLDFYLISNIKFVIFSCWFLFSVKRIQNTRAKKEVRPYQSVKMWTAMDLVSFYCLFLHKIVNLIRFQIVCNDPDRIFANVFIKLKSSLQEKKRHREINNVYKLKSKYRDRHIWDKLSTGTTMSMFRM